MSSYRLGIDIGGTFTDGALVDETTGEILIVKVPITPADPASGFMAVVERALQRAQSTSEAVHLLVHATTVATNALIEGKTARVGMITTEGFRDVLEIGRQIRSRLYDVHLTKPRPLVSRRWSFEVRERLDAAGTVLEPLDTEGVCQAVRQLQAEEVEAIVCCFLHSYINPAHERQAADIMRAEYPEAFLSISSEVCPEFREYLRASTTAVNAAIMPIVSRYLDALESRLYARGIAAPFYVMQSSGGVMSVQSAKQRPVYMVESGPAAGVIAAGAFALPHGYSNVISFDMGGTTAKIGLIRDGRPQHSTEFEVGGQAITPLGEGRGSGYPVRTPVIDLVEVGAGGGSEAWIDAGGALRVGPRSAGAVPGPVCYGQGGTTPTITDANLLLGRLNAEFFLGGEIALDLEASREAVMACCGQPLGLDPLQAASGIVEIANAHMMGAIRLISVQRGNDPRDFVLVAFGGAGPLHANALARELGIPTILIPPSPGIASALGMLMTDLTHEFVATRRQLLAMLEPAALVALFSDYEVQGGDRLAREGVAPTQRRLVRTLDLRYRGQSHELTVTVPAGDLTPQDLERVQEQFHEAHARAYGYAAREDAVELVNVRLTAIGVSPRPRLKALPRGTGDCQEAVKGRRAIWFSETSGFVSCPIVDRYRLRWGDRVPGPAVIEEFDSTTVIHPDYEVQTDEFGSLLLQHRSAVTAVRERHATDGPKP
jgi:N-methylhydantoinase A